MNHCNKAENSPNHTCSSWSLSGHVAVHMTLGELTFLANVDRWPSCLVNEARLKMVGDDAHSEHCSILFFL